MRHLFQSLPFTGSDSMQLPATSGGPTTLPQGVVSVQPSESMCALYVPGQSAWLLKSPEALTNKYP